MLELISTLVIGVLVVATICGAWAFVRIMLNSVGAVFVIICCLLAWAGMIGRGTQLFFQ